MLSPESDHFYKGEMYQNWGDVATHIHELVTNYARENKLNREMQSFGMCVCMYVCMYICMYVGVCVCACVC